MRTHTHVYTCVGWLYVWNFEFSDFVLLASHEPTLGRQQPIGAEPETLLKRQVRIVLTLTFYAIDSQLACVCMGV